MSNPTTTTTAFPHTNTETLDQMYATTWQLMRDKAVDNIFKATPLTYRLYNKGVKKESGGRYISVPLLYGKNTSVTTIGIGGAVDVVNDELITNGTATWKWLVANVIRYFGEDTMNNGKQAIMNLMQTKLKTAELSMIDKFESMLTTGGATTGNGNLEFDGLATYIRKDPTANETIMGINQSTAVSGSTYWWRNQYKDSSAATNAALMADVRNMYNNCSVGNDHPSLLLSTQECYEWYENQLVPLLRTYDTSMGDIGFEALKYKGAAWTWSPSLLAATTTSQFYGDGTNKHGIFFINERYFDLVIHSDADFQMTEWKPIPNQLDRVAQIVVQGNLTCSNRRMQGVLFGIPDATMLL